MSDHAITSPTANDAPQASVRLDLLNHLARALGRQAAPQMWAASLRVHTGAAPVTLTPPNDQPAQRPRRRHASR